jgi:hypothetical protein
MVNLKKYKTSIALSAIACGVLSPVSAQAVQFNFTYAPGTTLEQRTGVELAGGIWSKYLTDNVTVNLHFEMTSLGGELGGATPAIHKVNYDKLREGLRSDAAAGGYQLFLPNSSVKQDAYNVQLKNGTIEREKNYEVLQTLANNKSLGNDTSPDASKLDGYIQLNKSTSWDYGYATGSVNSSKYDFTSVALHEIGHTLGFISGIDVTNSYSLPTALDMFRYSKTSAASKAVHFRSDSEAAYFSTDGGKTAAGYFAGSSADVGVQAAHWADGSSQSCMMDHDLAKGAIQRFCQLDLKAMDYIGWQVNYQAFNSQLNLSLLKSIAQSKASTATISDRSSDVQAMMKESGIYNLGYGKWWQSEANASPQSVPEPTSVLALFGMALFGLGSRRKQSS